MPPNPPGCRDGAGTFRIGSGGCRSRHRVHLGIGTGLGARSHPGARSRFGAGHAGGGHAFDTARWTSPDRADAPGRNL